MWIIMNLSLIDCSVITIQEAIYCQVKRILKDKSKDPYPFPQSQVRQEVMLYARPLTDCSGRFSI